MSGSKILSEKEISEMRDDAVSAARRQGFKAAREADQNMDLDGYIAFLSDTRSLIDLPPAIRITNKNKL